MKLRQQGTLIAVMALAVSVSGAAACGDSNSDGGEPDACDRIGAVYTLCCMSCGESDSYCWDPYYSLSEVRERGIDACVDEMYDHGQSCICDE